MNPIKVSNLDVAFPTSVNHLMPSVPTDFTQSDLGRKCIKLVETWFYKGINKSVFMPKNGIDKNDALRHLSCIMQSFEPRHEVKIRSVAYLVSLWFEVK